MNTIEIKSIRWSTPWLTVFFLLVLTFVSNHLMAEPYLAYKNQMKCSSCHVNPTGGGMRNEFGVLYGQNNLAETPSEFISENINKLNQIVKIGGNLRYNAEVVQDDTDEKQQGFAIESAQLYFHINPSDGPVSLYIDQQIAPGASINREAYILYRFNGLDYIKLGRLFVPYGIRLQDDEALVRQATGFNFDNSDSGIELGLEYSQTTLNFFITNGTSAVSNDDDNLLYGLRAETLLNNYRLGATAVINQSEQETRFFNLYTGANFGKLTILGEVDWIQNETIAESDIEQWVGLIELNYQMKKGLNIKATAEYWDPNRHITENEENRHSLILEYTPVSNLQIRGGVRSGESIPQFAQRNYRKYFLQTHFYF